MYFRIKEARKAAKLTQRELAEKLGIKVSTLSGYEVGAHDPKSNTLTKIAEICETTVDYLLGVDLDMPKKEEKPAISDGPETELLTLYRSLNSTGQTTLLGTARGLAANPDMRKGWTYEQRDGLICLIPDW